jgi:hypothetical protein
LLKIHNLSIRYIIWSGTIHFARGISLGAYKWKKIKDTNYENEEVVGHKRHQEKWRTHNTIYRL